MSKQEGLTKLHRQGELDRQVAVLHVAVNNIGLLLREQGSERPLKMDSTVAFLVGALWTARLLEKRIGDEST